MLGRKINWSEVQLQQKPQQSHPEQNPPVKAGRLGLYANINSHHVWADPSDHIILGDAVLFLCLFVCFHLRKMPEGLKLEQIYLQKLGE